MKKNLRLMGLFALMFVIQLAHAQNGTADGTYHFGNLGADNSGGVGFKKQGDKFAVSNAYSLDSRDNSIYYALRDGGKGLQVDPVIKAEGGSVCKRFTLKDMDLYSFAGSYYQKWTYSKFVITLRNESGAQIASHQISSSIQIGAGAIGKLKDIPFTTPWPVAGYNGVARIELSYIAVADFPEILGFKNMTIANVSAGALPVSFGEVDATVGAGRLQVDWTTHSETNNERFVVQASANGTDWQDLGIVVSKAEGGRSLGLLAYSFATKWDGMALAGFGLLGLLLLPTTRNRLLRLGMLVLMVSVVVSCAKEKDGAAGLERVVSATKPVYVRVAQIDRNGSTSYSQMVVALKK
ncbi:hypothetical protein [Pedobacter sp. ASV28]|uniref:hypothetical protein n=1 Tax=Pedobacter sp. ASV28 TaxID=2795123 RepID=UPI0018EB6230|nr:hypothetical protein [Pedobacter sp. ASV28]